MKMTKAEIARKFSPHLMPCYNMHWIIQLLPREIVPISNQRDGKKSLILARENPQICTLHHKTLLQCDQESAKTMSSIRIRETIIECLEEIQTDSRENQQQALKTLVSITKVSPQNRNLLAQTDGVIPILFSLSKSCSPAVETLALSILFNLSLNPNLKQSLADMENIIYLNSAILSRGSVESSKLAATFLCSLAMLDKNKAKFGVAGTIQVLVMAISLGLKGPACHHLLSSLAELVQFHGNCTLAVQSEAVPMLIKIAKNGEGEDLAGTSLAILSLLARFEEGLDALRKSDQIVGTMLEVLKGRCMLSKEGAAVVLLRLFEESEGCIRDALRLPEFMTVLADISVRGSARARQKASLLMKKMMEANLDAYVDENSLLNDQW